MSDVISATSASRARDLAHHRPLAAVAVAARADDDDQPPRGHLARREQHLLQRIGLVRVVDDDAERLARVDRLEAARGASRRPRSDAASPSAGAPSARAAAHAPSAFEHVEAPRQRHPRRERRRPA